MKNKKQLDKFAKDVEDEAERKLFKKKERLPRKKKKALKKEMETRLFHFLGVDNLKILVKAWNKWGATEEEGKRITEIMAKKE